MKLKQRHQSLSSNSSEMVNKINSNHDQERRDSWLVNADKRHQHLLDAHKIQREHTPLRGSGSVVSPRSTVMGFKLQSQKSVENQMQNLMVSPKIMRQSIEPSHQEIKANVPEDHRHLLSLLKFETVHQKEPGQLTVTHSGENASIMISQRVHINISKGLNSSHDGSKVTSQEGFVTNQGTIASKEDTFPTQSEEKGSKELQTPTMLDQVLWKKQSTILNTSSLESALLSGDMMGIRIEDENHLQHRFEQAKLQLDFLNDSKPEFENVTMPMTYVKAKKPQRTDDQSEFKQSTGSQPKGFILKKYESIARKLDINSFDLSNTISPVGYTDLGSLPPPERRMYGSKRRAAVTPTTVGQLSQLKDNKYSWAPRGIGGITIESAESSSEESKPKKPPNVYDLAKIEHDAKIRQTFKAYLSANEQQSYLRTKCVNPKYNRALAAAMDARGWANSTRKYKKEMMLSQAIIDVCQDGKVMHDMETSPMEHTQETGAIKLSTSHGEVTLTLDDPENPKVQVESLRANSPITTIPSVNKSNATALREQSPVDSKTPDTLDHKSAYPDHITEETGSKEMEGTEERSASASDSQQKKSRSKSKKNAKKSPASNENYSPQTAEKGAGMTPRDIGSRFSRKPVLSKGSPRTYGDNSSFKNAKKYQPVLGTPRLNYEITPRGVSHYSPNDSDNVSLSGEESYTGVTKRLSRRIAIDSKDQLSFTRRSMEAVQTRVVDDKSDQPQISFGFVMKESPHNKRNLFQRLKQSHIQLDENETRNARMRHVDTLMQAGSLISRQNSSNPESENNIQKSQQLTNRRACSTFPMQRAIKIPALKLSKVGRAEQWFERGRKKKIISKRSPRLTTSEDSQNTRQQSIESPKFPDCQKRSSLEIRGQMISPRRDADPFAEQLTFQSRATASVQRSMEGTDRTLLEKGSYQMSQILNPATQAQQVMQQQSFGTLHREIYEHQARLDEFKRMLDQQLKDQSQPVRLPEYNVALSIPHTNMADHPKKNSSHPDSNDVVGDPGTATIVGSFTIGQDIALNETKHSPLATQVLPRSQCDNS